MHGNINETMKRVHGVNLRSITGGRITAGVTAVAAASPKQTIETHERSPPFGLPENRLTSFYVAVQRLTLSQKYIKIIKYENCEMEEGTVEKTVK